MITLYFKSNKLKVTRNFSTIKVMTQYIRRHNIALYKMYDKNEQFVIVGNQVFYIKYLSKIITDAEEPL